MIVAQMVAMGELMNRGIEAGDYPEKVVQALRGGPAGCWALGNKPHRLFQGNHSPGFIVYIQAKDLGIVMDTAREYGIPLPAASIHT